MCIVHVYVHVYYKIIAAYAYLTVYNKQACIYNSPLVIQAISCSLRLLHLRNYYTLLHARITNLIQLTICALMHINIKSYTM